MDISTNDNFEELPSVETPEDVAVLYSWANLHGAKYRDFSASRREYRAQLRHRAAEQTRDTDLQAQAGAEAAARQAEQQSRVAAEIARAQQAASEEAARVAALREAEQAAALAAAERVEAARRAEAAAQAEATARREEREMAEARAAAARREERELAESKAAAARREEREMAEASAAARRQAALFRDADSRRRRAALDSGTYDLPGKISDPYTPEHRGENVAPPPPAPEPAVELHPMRLRTSRRPERPEGESRAPERRDEWLPASSAPWQQADEERAAFESAFRSTAEAPASPTPIRRPQGYRPDDASGVRQIYRGPEAGPTPPMPHPPRQPIPVPRRPRPDGPVPPYATRETTLPRLQATAEEIDSDQAPRTWTPAPSMSPDLGAPAEDKPAVWSKPAAASRPELRSSGRAYEPAREISGRTAAPQRPAEPVSQPDQPSQRPAGELEDPTPRRRRQDLAGHRVTDSDRAIAAYRREQAQAVPYANAGARPAASTEAPPTGGNTRPAAPVSAPLPRAAEVPVPAWIHGQQPLPAAANSADRRESPAPPVPPAVPEPTVADTLQRSRERVASRWYALKGVFEHPGQERPEPQPVRQKETRTPVLAVFSLAGGVGKTSLVATLGRSLSSLGEKVLLTDTTSHGLLPFYFGASELRPGTVRTFSPPSGSTDAPIYMVNYAVDQVAGDDAAQQAVVDEITSSGRGAHRILLDLTSSTGWIARRAATLNPTVLVPLAPDMNSVISLGSVEKFFHGVNGPDGTPLKVFYVLNQFDTSLPLHLDVREVLRRQLGERLLPMVIRRAPAVSEALAEGMTIVDYAADAPVAGDYMNIATWLRSLAAPATAGFRNVRWSER